MIWGILYGYNRHNKIYDICNSKGYGMIAMETDKDHIHFLISYDTTDRV